MPYQSIIPRAPDILSQSQDDLLQNYTAINTYLQADHYTFAEAFPGLHKQMRFQLLQRNPLRNIPNSVGLYYAPINLVPNPNCLQIQNFVNPISTPYSLLIVGNNPRVSFSILGYGIGMLTFPVQVDRTNAQPEIFNFPNPIPVPGILNPAVAWPPFTNIFNYSLTMSNDNIIFNDSNIFSYVGNAPALTNIQINSYLRSGAGAFDRTATVYVRVIGSIAH